MSIGRDVLAGWLVTEIDGLVVDLEHALVSVKMRAHLGIEPDREEQLVVTFKSEDAATLCMGILRASYEQATRDA